MSMNGRGGRTRNGVALGSVATFQYGLSEKNDPDGDRIYIGMGQLQMGRVVDRGANRLTVAPTIANRYGLKIGDVLFNRTNSLELVGKTAIVRDERIVGAVFASYLVRLQVDEERYDPRFINLWMNSPNGVEKLRRMATPGVAQFNIRPSLLAKRFLVPDWSLGHQRKVADVDQEFDSVLDKLDDLIGLKRQLQHGLAHELLSGRVRSPTFSGGARRLTRLGEVMSFVPRKVPKPSGTFLAAGIRSHGKGVFLKEAFPAEAIALDELFTLKTGDFVINITFGWEGALAIVPPYADGALVSHRFPTYEVDESKLLIEYLRHVIRSKRFVFDVGVASPGGAGRNRVLNRRAFMDIQIELPGIEEQRGISQVLNAADHEIDLLVAQRKQYELYKRGLLVRLLSGEIPVAA